MRFKAIDWRVFLFGLACGFPLSGSAMDLSWNGFGSVYYGQALERELLPYAFTNDHVDFTSFSLIGLNLGASVNEDLDFAAQFVALGESIGATESFALMTQWAFANYKPVDDTSIKAGRQLYPALLASDYVRVGYLLPFRQIPYETMGIGPFTRFDGVSIARGMKTPFGKFTFGIFGGSPLLDAAVSPTSGLAFNISDLVGAQATLDGEGWRIRAQASRFFSELTMSAPLPAAYLHGHTQVYSLGYRYDRNRIVSWGELIYSQTPDGSAVNGGKYVGQGHGLYWLGGYRIGKFMPRYTFAREQNAFNILIASGYSNGRATTHTLGVNYQAGEQAVLKAEYEQILLPNPQRGGYFVTQAAGSQVTSAGAFYAGMDFIF